MRTFRNYLNESYYGTIELSNYFKQDPIPIYINPTLKDISELLAAVSKSHADDDDDIRGLTKGNDVYVWDFSKAQHMEVARELKLFPDVCFYLTVTSKNPYRFRLTISPFSGKSSSSLNNAKQHLQSVVDMPGMKELAPLIDIDHEMWVSTFTHGPKTPPKSPPLADSLAQWAKSKAGSWNQPTSNFRSGWSNE